MSGKLIVVLLDGVGADLFALYRHRLPHLHGLAQGGTLVQRLGADANANSMPARAGMLTGVDATRHGIYANNLWNGQHFSPATAVDVRVPTLARLARSQGKTVASVGFGLVSADDCDWYLSPWWEDGCQRAKALDTPGIHPLAGSTESLTRVAANDHRLLQQAWQLLEQQHPDLLLLELNSPDYCQHVLGDDRELVAWSLELVDAQLGCLLTRLHESGLASQYNLAIVSDHGHALVETTLVIEHIIPGVNAHCDGGLLFVAYQGAAELDDIDTRLSAHGVTRLDSLPYLPTTHTDRLAVFVAPKNTSFEPASKHADSASTAKPKYISTHGMGPDHAEDERIAIFAGPGIPVQQISRADSLAVTPTLARLLGITYQPAENPHVDAVL
ncbi:alkaline phosphatase family protein [Zobellella maritima]|uniref:alkaline phosphatase family protein n=1 Tax=Zobellella maritima TaxID=2059725 RepID=UPI001300B47C|nr:alkaline phosphatase family protein [Zobellella maritima]